VERLIDGLREAGYLRSDAIAAAMRALPRHEFVTQFPPEDVYSDIALDVRTSGGETTVASQPGVVVAALEALRPAQGWRVLDVGTGTGWLAALIGSLVAPTGSVLTVDVVPSIVSEARSRFRRLQVENVHAELADASTLLPGLDTWDAIVVGAAVGRVPAEWLRRLKPGGIVVMPLAVSIVTQTLCAFWRDGAWLRGHTMATCGFVPLRGACAPVSEFAPVEVARGVWLTSDAPDAVVPMLQAATYRTFDVDGLGQPASDALLYWMTLRFPLNFALDVAAGGTGPNAAGSVPMSLDVLPPGSRWVGVGRVGAIALFRVDSVNSALEARLFGDSDFATELRVEAGRFDAEGRPDPHRVHLDIGPVGEPLPSGLASAAHVTDRPWARLVVRVL
jgi:protein-L-isoaspartate(D-aspartate) O-methyltransferase